MDKMRKKISVNPPEGEAVARYSVKIKPLDVFKRQIFTHVLPMAIKNTVKILLFGLGVNLLLYGMNFLLEKLFEIHDIFTKLEEYVKYPKIILFALFAFYLIWELSKVVIAGITARTEAVNTASASLPEEYAFFEGGMIFSNGKDIVRISWKKVVFAFTFPYLGLVIFAPSATDTLIIPPRYFCREFEELRKTLRKKLSIRFIVFKNFSRDKDPQFENMREKITVFSPIGDPIATIDASLRFTDMAEINNLYNRQIANKHFRGLFGILLLLLCAMIFFTSAVILREKMFITVGIVMILLMVVYVICLTVSNMFGGKKILVNRRTYKQAVRYVFYPAGFLMVYENGISHVMYEDLDLMFEDEEGLALFFSPKQCLFLPTRYMRSPEGIRLSHFFKASLFNLDPRRGRRKYRIEDKPLFDFTKVKALLSKKIEFTIGRKEKQEATDKTTDNGFGF